MSRIPSVVFCITCKGRTDHLRQTLPANLRDNPGAKFVVLNYNSGDGLVQFVTEEHGAEMRAGSVVLYSNFAPERFHMAHAKNMAHRCGIREGGDVLVNLDADNFTGPGFADYLADEFHGRGEMFMWGRMVKGLLDRGISGRIAVTRNGFLMAGGYDEKYATWSPDDEDFRCRLRLLGFNGAEIDPRFLMALKHSDKMRFREYPHIEPGAYGDGAAKCDPHAPIANAGNVGCGTVYRNESGRPVELGRIPARIFGIGMHKTGTSSLHAAFQILGFNSAHWNTALWARAVWEEIHVAGRSGTMERHYAFSDLPFPLLFRELDAAYPGSKFILTTRDESEWIRSVENHWDYRVNPFRKDWDIAPFTHKLHTRLYGRRTFDAPTFLNRYRQHNREVLEHFRGRDQDLLIMDASGDWDALCRFLGVPVPSVPYPHKLATREYQPDYAI